MTKGLFTVGAGTAVSRSVNMWSTKMNPVSQAFNGDLCESICES